MSSSNYLEAFRYSFEQKPAQEDLLKPAQAAPGSEHWDFPKRPLLEISSLARAEVETLFMILAYQRGEYERFVAAQLLRQRGWRFHKKFQMWFKRNSEPREVTDEFERGDYIFFDSTEHWKVKTMRDFKFEYKFND